MIDASTKLVLTNAIYFKGDWNSPFKKDQTRDESFDDGSDAKRKVPMMHQTERFKYHDAGDVQVLEMPYAGKELSMVVLLPQEGRRPGRPGEVADGRQARRLAGQGARAGGHRQPAEVQDDVRVRIEG